MVTRQYSATTTLKLVTTQGRCEVNAGVLDALPVSLLIGRDCPLFHRLWREVQERRSRETLQPRGKRQPNRGRPKNVSKAGLTHTSSPVNALLCAAESSSDAWPASEGEGEEPQRSNQPSSSEDTSQAADRPPPLSGQYGTAQLNDPTLINALRNVRVLKGVDQRQGIDLIYPHFAVKNGLLYQMIKVQDEVIEQLLVPKSFRPTVLQLALTHLLGAHLGVEKTKDKNLTALLLARHPQRS